MKILHLTPEDTRILPRPGELGIAREWVVWPPKGSAAPEGEGAAFDVRISSVELAAPGPLATLPGYDRMLIVTEGEGLILSHGEEAPRANVRRLESYNFQGDWPTEAELSRGVVTVFNVTTRRRQAEARVETLRLGTRQVMESLESPAALAHCIRGSFTARLTGEDEPFEIQGGESLWLHELAGAEDIELEGTTTDCEALLVRVQLA